MSLATDEVEKLATWRVTVARCQISFVDPAWPSDPKTKLKAMILLVGDMHDRASRLLEYEALVRLPMFEAARDRRLRWARTRSEYLRFERPYQRRIERLRRLREQCDYVFYLFMDLTRELCAHG